MIFAAKKIPKPWGFELLWARTERYVGKILHIRKGECLSYQYHRVKDETIYLLRGLLDLKVAGEKTKPRVLALTPGKSYRIPAKLRHRLIAVEECDVLEASTSQLQDVVRLDDKYGRVPNPDGRNVGKHQRKA